jgi:hypothetical protein
MNLMECSTSLWGEGGAARSGFESLWERFVAMSRG